MSAMCLYIEILDKFGENWGEMEREPVLGSFLSVSRAVDETREEKERNDVQHFKQSVERIHLQRSTEASRVQNPLARLLLNSYRKTYIRVFFTPHTLVYYEQMQAPDGHEEPSVAVVESDVESSILNAGSSVRSTRATAERFEGTARGIPIFYIKLECRVISADACECL